MFYFILVTITLRLLNVGCLQGLQGVDIVGVDSLHNYAYLYLSPSLTCLLVLIEASAP